MALCCQPPQGSEVPAVVPFVVRGVLVPVLGERFDVILQADRAIGGDGTEIDAERLQGYLVRLAPPDGIHEERRIGCQSKARRHPDSDPPITASASE